MGCRLLRNAGIYVFGFDTEAGQNLYINAIKNYTSTGLIDGFFGDKFDKAATLSQNAMGGKLLAAGLGWQIRSQLLFAVCDCCRAWAWGWL